MNLAIILFTLLFISLARTGFSTLATNEDETIISTTTQNALPHPLPESRIVGGNNAAEGQFPHQVYLKVNGRFKCGGSIIGQNYVLTAAHCVVAGKVLARPISASSLTITAGGISLYTGGHVIRVSSIRVHPLHRNNRNDIAVLKLSKPLSFNNYIKSIALADQVPPSGARVITSGWGSIRKGGLSAAPALQFTVLTALSNAQCRLRLGLIPSTILCLAHAPGNGVCSGDSGGPAVYQNQLVGITNFVVGGCASSNPDGYASVAAHLNWIKQQLRY